MNQEKYKQEDVLICCGNFDTDDSSGGSGWVQNRVFTVARISSTEDPDRIIYWPKEHIPNTNGIYGRACKLHVKEEVINDYSIY